MRGTLLSWVVRGALLTLSVMAALVIIQWRQGTYTGTFQSNLRARASLVAYQDWSRSDTVLPGLAADGGEFAQVWDDTNNLVLWRSPGLEPHDLPSRYANGRLYWAGVPGKPEKTAVAVTLKLTDDLGQPRRVTYLSTETALTDSMTTSILFGVIFAVLPVSLFVLMMSRIKR